MGFFSGKKTTVPATGFYAQPQAYQDLYNNILNTTKSAVNGFSNDMFTPTPLSSNEQSAIDNINQGFAPTQDSIYNDVSMQSNPYDEFVIDGINRQADGQNSILQQNLQGVGQSGSNRQMLGANDIDLSRLQQIGNFKQGQYNTALNNALNLLPNARRTDASSQMATGDFLRGLASENKLAPLNLINAEQGILSGQPQINGSPSYTVKSGGGLGAVLDAAKVAAKIYVATSDRRLKENISLISNEKGFNIYQFSYINEPNKIYQGVMADEVEKTNPDAVITNEDGYKMVDYGKIGIEFKEVA